MLGHPSLSTLKVLQGMSLERSGNVPNQPLRDVPRMSDQDVPWTLDWDVPGTVKSDL